MLFLFCFVLCHRVPFTIDALSDFIFLLLIKSGSLFFSDQRGHILAILEGDASI